MNAYVVANTRWFLKGRTALANFLLADLNCKGFYRPLYLA
jgi:hypothetical protein